MDKAIPTNERKKRRMRRAARIGLIGAAIVAVAAVAVNMSRSSVRLAELQTGVADSGTIETTVNSSGRVSPGLEEIITSPISARILTVYKKMGDMVEEGEPILQLDLTSAQTQYDQMVDEKRMKELQLEQARINSESALREQEMRLKVKEMSVNSLAMELRNEQQLDSIGSGTGDNVRRARYAWETARLELEQMRSALADARAISSADMRLKEVDLEIFSRKVAEAGRTLTDARILAPRRAVLTQISSEIGRQVSAGAQVAVVSELDHYKIDCDIADNYADRIAAGSRVAIKIGKQVIDGVISDLSPVSSSGVIAFTVRPDNDSHPALRSGVRADVYVKTNIIDDAVRLPNGPYYSTGPGSYPMFVVSADGSSLERREVILGQSNYEFVEVLSGIEPGERVVISDMTPYKNQKSLKLK
ncbi:MAG: HlyD family efflux transporter periplasmic adaptor subunit [Bacteroides sp.]|nr:HlyD family efflux transporter periplasmic adaptor subunit [Bacteroides sp.]MBD5424713.1 HlyD family efflux transporter periplasmic adaptor subunit [Bacteroides sp.]